MYNYVHNTVRRGGTNPPSLRCGDGATLPGFDLRSKSTTYNQRLRHGGDRGKVFALVKRGASKSISYNQWIRA